MPTETEVKQFFDQMDKDMAETRELLASEKMLMDAVARYEKAWGVKIKVPLAKE